MLALLLLLEIAFAHQAYRIDDTDTIKLASMERVELISSYDPNIEEAWVVGNLPSEKITTEEGRFSRRRRSETEEGITEQFFTFISGGGAEGDVLAVEFWFIKPHYAEMYFNDPDAYAEMHGGMPKIKIIEFHIKASDKTQDL